MLPVENDHTLLMPFFFFLFKQVNSVRIWALENKRNDDIDQWSRSVHIDVEPRLLCEVQHSGDVTELVVSILVS